MVEELRRRISGEEFDYQALLDGLREYDRPRDKITNLLRQGGIIRSVAFDAEDRIFQGRVLGVSSALIGFEGATVADLEKDFQNAVDDYLEMCAEQGKEPEKPFKGSFNIRLSPDLHQSLVLNAANQKMTLNAYIKTVLEQVVTADRRE